MNSKIKNITSEILSDNWSTLSKINFDYQMPEGNWVNQNRESYDRGNGVTILLYNKEKQNIILIEQFRMPTYVNGNENGMLIESCAGVLDMDSTEDCIKKEVLEETGYQIDTVEKVFESYMSPGACTEIIYFFIGEYDESMKVAEGGGLDIEHEDIITLELPFQKALDMIATGEIKDAKTIMLLQYAALHKILGNE
ncbi:MAG: GDP-mannose pyrophosphatase NudK [Bacteroidota bacterium]